MKCIIPHSVQILTTVFSLYSPIQYRPWYHSVLDDLDVADPFPFLTWNHRPRFNPYRKMIRETIPVHVVQEKDTINAQLHVPYFRKDNIRLKLIDNEIHITGERPCANRERCEKKTFSETLVLPHGTDFSTAKSYLDKNGWLSIELKVRAPSITNLEIEDETTLQTESNYLNGDVDNDDVIIEDEISKPLCSETSNIDNLYDIGV